MANFPSIENPSKITETNNSFRIKERSSAGYTMVIQRSTLRKKVFVLEWEVLTDADKVTLDSFFDTNNSLDFVWTDPQSAVNYTVCFKDDGLKYTYVAPDYWAIKFSIEEI